MLYLIVALLVFLGVLEVLNLAQTRRAILSTNDPLASLQMTVNQMQQDMQTLSSVTSKLVNDIAKLLAGAPSSGTVNVSTSELAGLQTTAQQIDTAIQAAATSGTAADASANPAPPPAATTGGTSATEAPPTS